MSESLKDKLNARAQEAAAKQQSDDEAQKRYQATVLREYPRMFSELLASVRKLLDGVQGLTITPKPTSVELKRTVGTHSTDPAHHTAHEISLGRVQLNEFEVSFLNRHLAFKSGGLDYMGVHGKIEVAAKGASNPFDKDGIFISSSREEPGTWYLVVPVPQQKALRGNSHTVLTDEILAERLERFLA